MGKSLWLKVKMGPNLENVGLYMCKWSKCNGRHRDFGYVVKPYGITVKKAVKKKSKGLTACLKSVVE
jgi:hypothetical protein